MAASDSACRVSDDSPGAGPAINAYDHSYRWLMLAGASLVYAGFGGLMAGMSVLVKPISDSLGLSPLDMGTVLGAWQFVYLFAAIPAGVLIDRVGLRSSLVVAGLIITLSSAMRMYADSYAALLLAVCLFGLGGPLISVGAPKLVSRWFAGAERGLAMGIFMSSTAVGALLATVGTNSVVMPLVGFEWDVGRRDAWHTSTVRDRRAGSCGIAGTSGAAKGVQRRADSGRVLVQTDEVPEGHLSSRELVLCVDRRIGEARHNAQ